MSALDEIRGRLEAATPGPWEHEPFQGSFGIYSLANTPHHAVVGYARPDESGTQDDAEFIAHAPTDVACLLADVQNVLNLHAPSNDGSDELYCRHCYAPPYGHAHYPCPTVKAITSALEGKS